MPARWVRAGLVLLLFGELLCTLPWPWSALPHAKQLLASLDDGDVQYHSTALLQRSQRVMRYNKHSQQYETPQLAIWHDVHDLFTSKPAAGLATWLDITVAAKHPWAAFWLFALAPRSWRVMPEQVQQDLALLQAGLPVMHPYASAHFSAPERWLLQQAGYVSSDFLPPTYVVCTAAVNDTTLQPQDSVTCSVFDSSTSAGPRLSSSTFAVLPDKPRTCRAAHASPIRQPQPCPFLGPGLIIQPAARAVARLVQQCWGGALLLTSLRQLWFGVVPTGGLVRPLCPLLSNLHFLGQAYLLDAILLSTLVLVVSARNWLYLITVCYKISRRLALLAAAPLRVRLSGVALTLLGMFLGLWQSVAYTAIDTAFDVLLYKIVCFGLAQCSLVVLVSWKLWFGFACLRIGSKTWQLAKQAFREARLLVVAPQALLVQNQNVMDKLPRRQVAVVGTWPAPLVIPEEVDELPVSEVPRGFICPITQAIMRQPALLLHDGTIAPSTYDKDAISQWLAEHSSDPKNPGVALAMKSVKLVYNGELGRAIEDWVSARQQQYQQQQQQQQEQMGLVAQALRRALAGHMEGHPDGPGGGMEGMAAAAAGMLMQMRGTLAADAPPRDAGAAPAAGTSAQDGPAAGAARGPGGSILSGAGALVRTSSAALAQVASMDLPTAAVVGLNQLAGTTRRITTRALARRQQEQEQQQQQHLTRLQRWQQQQQQDDLGANPGSHPLPEEVAVNSSDSGQEQEPESDGSEVESRRLEQHPRRSPRVQQREGSRSASGTEYRRQPRRRASGRQQ